VKMTQDERLETALARLSAALASLEAASKQNGRSAPASGFDPCADSALLEQAGAARVAKLEAAIEEASHFLEVAIRALAEILSRPDESPDE
jgi:hypothetical protein